MCSTLCLTWTSEPERPAGTSVDSSYREITLKQGESLNAATVLPILSAALLLTSATSLMTTCKLVFTSVGGTWNLLTSILTAHSPHHPKTTQN